MGAMRDLLDYGSEQIDATRGKRGAERRVIAYELYSSDTAYAITGPGDYLARSWQQAADDNKREYTDVVQEFANCCRSIRR